ARRRSGLSAFSFICRSGSDRSSISPPLQGVTMKRITFSPAVAGLFALAITVFLPSCFPQPDISGTYTTAVHARQGNGRSWNGTAEILLTQTGASLTGHVTLHHPAAG